MSSTAVSAQGTILQVSASSSGAKTISAVQPGFPTIFTSAAHGLTNGDVGPFSGFTGADAAALNGVNASIENVTANTFAADINTIGKTITAPGTFTPAQWAKVGNLRTISGFDGKPDEIDTTNLDSVGKESLTGLVDYGSLTLEVDQDNEDAGQLKLLAAFQASAKRNFRLTLPNGDVATFVASVTQFTTSLGVGQVIKRTVGLRISGAVAWA